MKLSSPVFAAWILGLGACPSDSSTRPRDARGPRAASAPNAPTAGPGPRPSTGQATDAGAPTTGGAPRLDLGAPDCGLDNGDLGLSFIWIANSTQGTVSKIDTVRPAEGDAGAGIRGLTRPSPAALQRRRLSVGGPRPRA